MCVFPFIFYDGIAIDNVIEVTNSDVDVTANDVEIPMLRSTIRPSLTSTNASLSFMFQPKLWLRQGDGTKSGQDWHLIDTDKFECCH
jgi:hypothetical protein